MDGLKAMPVHNTKIARMFDRIAALLIQGDSARLLEGRAGAIVVLAV
ncbi:hypothetical protein LRP30_04555 [Bradyrhizobium sp. C-145]|nr:hypothetical protein [Bradyrhizobium sp. C-145]UQR64580.1 hypothetical protein LRP30_04555 [Bradyrhizobium sp. C-145]